MDEARRRRIASCIALAERARDETARSGGEVWLDRLESELGALRAALEWLAGPGGLDEAEQAMRLAGALRNFWHARGHLAEGRRWFARLLALPRAAGRTAARARALDDAGALAFWDGEPGTAKALAEESLAIERDLGNRERTSLLLSHIGTLVWLGEDDPAAAWPYFEEALGIARALADGPRLRAMLYFAGMVALELGDRRRARATLEESLAIERGTGNKRQLGFALVGAATAASHDGDPGAARGYLGEAIALGRELADKWLLLEAIEAAASAAAAQGAPRRALQLASAAAALRGSLSAPAMPALQARLERRVGAARAALSAAEQAAAERVGRRMTLDEAAACALQAGSGQPRRP